jgi:hypothetical protein
VYNSTPTNNYLIKQANENAPYVPAPIFSPTTPGNGIIDSTRNVPTNLTATSVARDDTNETFEFTWTRPTDYYIYETLVFYSRKDYIGDTQFVMIKSLLEVEETTVRESFSNGPRQYTVRVQYATRTGQLSAPADVTITTANRYSTTPYHAGVKVYNSVVNTI